MDTDAETKIMADTVVSIDRDDCISCGNCWTVCPQVFRESSEDGKSELLPNFRSGNEPGKGNVPVNLKACAEQAEEECPVHIIHVD